MTSFYDVNLNKVSVKLTAFMVKLPKLMQSRTVEIKQFTSLYTHATGSDKYSYGMVQEMDNEPQMIISHDAVFSWDI